MDNVHVSDQGLQEFKNLYTHEYGVQLDDETARRKAIRVLKVMKIVYGSLIVPKNMTGGETNYGKTEV